MKQKWYLKTWFICILFACWFIYGVPLIIGIILLVFKIKEEKSLNVQINQLISDNANSQAMNYELNKKLEQLGAFDYFRIQELTAELESEYAQKLLNAEAELQKSLYDLTQNCNELKKEKENLNLQLEETSSQLAKLIKSTKTQTNKLNRSKELVKAIDYALENFLNYEPGQNACRLKTSDIEMLEELSPSIMLKLHCMDVKDLRKAFLQNDKQITSILEKYSARYTTKANQAIYKLMVIALRAELQNILYNLKYEKLDIAIENVKSVTQKYLKIAGEGNQSIAGTLAKFIGEIEYLFINAVKIEYNYYVKKEQAKQEQLAIREQMRQEAEERKALEAERKKVELEESKYNSEIEKLKEQLTIAKDEEVQQLNARILALQSQLAAVVVKKEEISKLANGKAGNVYVISNIGSFGENVFKIGMTRRLNPQERVDELGNASVPFKFDVHSFIFSDDAVGLESRLHDILDEKRVNKVNRRKEFFYVTVDELEELVTEIEPTAEFNRTMLAEEFRQSQSSDLPYTSDWLYEKETD